MNESSLHIGILFTAMVNIIIASASTMFFIFLARRWTVLQEEMRAYCVFYFLTALAWFFIASRYIMIGFGYEGALILHISQITQSLLVCTGAPLMFYAGRRIFQRRSIAVLLATIASCAAFVSIFLLLQRGGIGSPRIAFFSADAPINNVSLTIFITEVAFIACLLTYDFGMRMYQWSKSRDTKALYTALYSSGVLLYVAIGGLDQAKVFTGGLLVIFRSLYAAAFLFTYIIIVKRESLEEEYFIEDNAQI